MVPTFKYPLSPCLFEFHLSKACRERYRVDQLLFGYSGRVLLVNLAQAQSLAKSINDRRRAEGFRLPQISPAELYALGLLDEILHIVAERYRRKKNPAVFAQAAEHLRKEFGPGQAHLLFLSFTHDFPPLPVHLKQSSPEDYLQGQTQGYPHLSVAAEELLHLWLANQNPALKDFLELFDDTNLARSTQYLPAIKSWERFFRTQPRFGPYGQTLFELLQSPARYAPNSLADQLRYIKENWTEILPPQLLERILQRLLLALDTIKEETKFRGPGPGPSHVLDFRRQASGPEDLAAAPEPRQYSSDWDWMPQVVLLAKHTLVWLWQLSRKYGYQISRLDQIPEVELGEIVDRGINALWLIGVWERSSASQKIKRLCGNPEAVSSAYSLYDYTIAASLGGDPAYFALKEKAQSLGLRLAVDMVPNHTGLYSKWVIEHPDWFIGLNHPPFPQYTFNGPDLSDDPSVGLYLEDGYWTKTDAAVVFKRVDRKHGVVHYLYHGNDGTHLPWNDTAQLNFLLPQVREAVIQQILKVAGYAPIIRFDAAMTLAKRHYQRLWFPAPGSGGDIPSRAWHGLSRQEFEAAFPQEFWRQVVDRMAAEAPDTLLLAEAFWLMEGYFVRTLGMHRVYNSAFMNMLRREENANFRQVLKNVLEFDPHILGRFVNFMNNPDEEPASAQFGKDDKYFGVCLMMSTLPGLPMFGHGQMEGLYEKYGMEYSRAYWDETPDQSFLERHLREISPLLKRRHLFSGVANFLLYDVVDEQGHIQDDIFAYSNGHEGERVLVVFNNRYRHNSGWVHRSVPYRQHPDDAQPTTQHLFQGLALGPGDWCLFRDQASGLEYIRSTEELKRRGLFLSLPAYRYHVFCDFRVLRDDERGDLARLHQQLGGAGVPSLERARWEIRLEFVLEVYARILSPLAFKGFLSLVQSGLGSEAEREAFFTVFETQLAEFIHQSRLVSPPRMEGQQLRLWANRRLRTTVEFLGQQAFARLKDTRPGQRFLAAVEASDLDCSLDTEYGLRLFYGLLVIESLSNCLDLRPAQELFFSKLQECFERSGLKPEPAALAGQLVRILAEDPPHTARALDHTSNLKDYIERPEVLQYLGGHWHRDVFWFIKERLQALLYWLFASTVLQHGLAWDTKTFGYRRRLLAWAKTAARAMETAAASGYDFNRFLELLAAEHLPPPPSTEAENT